MRYPVFSSLCALALVLAGCPAEDGDSGDDGCSHFCDWDGQRVCEGDQYRECWTNEAGCRYWSDLQSCPSEQYCTGEGICAPLGSDAGLDAGSDVAADVELDTSSDPAVDSATDSSSDSSPDTNSDTGVDTTSDLASDPTPDAPPEATRFSAAAAQWALPDGTDIWDGDSFYALSPTTVSDGWATLDLTGDGLADLVWTRDAPSFAAWGMPLNPHWRVYAGE